jgi:hypothetical protein
VLSFKRYIQYYQEHWQDLRCQPTIMPFAGFINKPDGLSFIAFTEENYKYCNQETINKEMVKQMSPFYETQQKNSESAQSANKNVAGFIQSNNETADNTESAMNAGADKITKTASIMNYGYTLFMSFFSKITDIMTSFFQFSLTGVTWSNMFVKVLSWAFTIILTVFFVVSVVPAIPFFILIFPLLVYILWLFVLIILYKFDMYGSIINSSMSTIEPFTLKQPKPRKISLCFDQKTQIKTINGSKKIKKIKIGDVLQNGEMVTATFKTIAPNTMFKLKGIVVSGDHYVFNNGWVKVKYHPESIEIPYRKKFLYCLNTTSKKIRIGDQVFMDWDELNDNRIKIITQYLKSHNKNLNELHSFMDKGYLGGLMVKTNLGTKRMFNLQPGDILYDGSRIMAKVTIKGDDLYRKNRHLKIYNVVTDTGFFKNKRDYNFIIDKLFYMT